MLYHFELQMAGVILLGAMLVCGIFLYTKRRRDRLQEELDEHDNMWSDHSNSNDTEDTRRNDVHRQP